MRYSYARVLAALVIFFLTSAVYAQKNIVLAEELAKNSAEWKVKMGVKGMGKIFKIHFSDYGVVSSKAGWTTTTTRGHLFNAETETKTKQKFSFRFAGKSSDTANVNAAIDINTTALRALPFFPMIDWEAELDNTNNLLAVIAINRDTTNSWAMYLQTKRSANQAAQSKGVLFSGDRKINFLPITSNRDGSDTRSMPAEGFEFTENENAVAALQYFGGGVLGANKNIIWMHNSLDEKTRLVIAAAMTAILESIYGITVID